VRDRIYRSFICAYGALFLSFHILVSAESQGFPRQPALERIYRQTGASLVQLGFLGVGAAVFADLHRELLD
jgi:hypothetical protein